MSTLYLLGLAVDRFVILIIARLKIPPVFDAGGIGIEAW
ncbi:MAG: hypothetical protein RLZZ422_201 [Pseudomonadota bacterium]|jgi:hypothetical protein